MGHGAPHLPCWDGPKERGNPRFHPSAKLEEGGAAPIPTFLWRVPVKDDPGQVERGDGPEAGEHQVDEEQQADGSCGSQGGG